MSLVSKPNDFNTLAMLSGIINERPGSFDISKDIYSNIVQYMFLPKGL